MMDIITLLIFVMPARICSGASFSDVTNLLLDLRKPNYFNNNVRPVLDQDQPLNVSLNVSLTSLNDFDEVAGELDISMYAKVVWRDDILHWDPADYGGIQSVLLQPGAIWDPQFFFLNAASDTRAMWNAVQIRLWHDGMVTWHPGASLKVTCDVDVTYFPFDTQTCRITIASGAHTEEEVLLKAESDTVSTDLYNEDSQWDLVSTRLYSDSMNHGSILHSELVLKRRSKFMIVYVIVPIVLLGACNCFIFLIPAVSGERTSVAVTMFLAIVVFLSIINEIVPQSSRPVAYIYTYVLFLTVYSYFVLSLGILSLRLHEKTGSVSNGWKIFVKIASCSKCSFVSSKEKSQNMRDVELEHNEKVQNSESPMFRVSRRKHARYAASGDNATSNENMTSQVTWSDVAKLVDMYLFLCSFIIFQAYSIFVFAGLKFNVVF